MPLYFITAILYFWVPTLILGAWLIPKQDALTKKAIWWTLTLFYSLAAVMEYIYLYVKVWTFSEKVDPLLGPRIFGAPIEEFIFWFGATPFAVLVYLAFDRVMGSRRQEGARMGQSSVTGREAAPEGAGTGRDHELVLLQ